MRNREDATEMFEVDNEDLVRAEPVNELKVR